jgi:anthranilate synthase component II
MNLLLLDNHDSFTWNLVGLLRRHDKVNVNIITPEKLTISQLFKYDRVIFSPGPGLPDEQPVMLDILNKIGDHIPVLGVCLGLQSIALYFGGTLFNLPRPVHGQPRKLKILQPGHFMFRGIPDETQVGLYHSWAIDKTTLPGCLELLALSDEGIIMALSHKTLPVCGVQFHPESVITPLGARILDNWLEYPGTRLR